MIRLGYGQTPDFAGGLLDVTHPPGRVVENVLDGNGDLSLVQSKKNATAGFWHYADSISYTPAGAVTSLQLGNGHWESTTFNARLQPTQIALGALPGGNDLLKLDYGYESQGNHDNNGNVLSQTITVPNSAGHTDGFTAAQTYTYDELNRIKSATETIGGNQSWKQTFTFDRYGNRRFDFSNGNTTVPDPNCSEAICNPTISTANNRLTSTGWLHDSAGNTTRDGSYNLFTYDAENKQVLVKNGSNVTRGEYWYDGDGKRVKKKGYDSSGNAVEDTIFVYDATGRSIAEYSAIDPNQSEGGSTPQVAYLTNDHIGSPRINTDASGAVTSRHDYHPFGEETIAAQRTNQMDYNGDAVRNKFTGHEHDAETDLEFANARYYKSALAKFSTPDEFANDTQPTCPQSWNLYAYVRNGPLRYADRSGKELVITVNGNDYKVVRDGKTSFRLESHNGSDKMANATQGMINRLGEYYSKNIANVIEAQQTTVIMVNQDTAVGRGVPSPNYGINLGDGSNRLVSIQAGVTITGENDESFVALGTQLLVADYLLREPADPFTPTSQDNAHGSNDLEVQYENGTARTVASYDKIQTDQEDKIRTTYKINPIDRSHGLLYVPPSTGASADSGVTRPGYNQDGGGGLRIKEPVVDDGPGPPPH